MRPLLTAWAAAGFPGVLFAAEQQPGHFVDVNANQLSNEDGPEVWYTDAFGRNGQTEPFAGSIRQRLDSNVGVDAGGPVIGNNRSYAGPGVHAPN